MDIFAVSEPLKWLWSLGETESLAQLTVLAIALLSAFLTVVQVWQIPASTNSFAPPTVLPRKNGNTEKSDSAGRASAKESGGERPSSLLQNNFTTTVLSGIGGMAAVSLLGSFLGESADNSLKGYYLILFVLFFLTFLLGSALMRGFIEALRSRIAIPYEIPAWETWKSLDDGKVRGRLSYRGHRTWAWLLSQRTALLVFFDTAFNVIQGKNQLQSAVFGDRIVDLQWGLVKTVDRVRESLAKEVLAALKHERKGRGEGKEPDDEDVRVNISILSADGSSAFYVSQDPKSLSRPFGRHSIAWLSIAAGVARWCKMADGDLLYDKATKLLPAAGLKDLGASEVPCLGNYFEYREEPGYKAFIVIPVPWMGRGEEGPYRKAGIQISFDNAEYLDDLWEGLETGGGHSKEVQPNYDEWVHLLRLKRQDESHRGGHQTSRQTVFIKNAGLHAALHQAVAVLAETLRSFNDAIFDEVIRPQRET